MAENFLIKIEESILINWEAPFLLRLHYLLSHYSVPTEYKVQAMATDGEMWSYGGRVVDA